MIDNLQRIQKAYDKSTLKERKKLTNKTKLDRFFREAGIVQEVLPVKIVNDKTETPLNFFSRPFKKYFESTAKHREYLKKQSILKKIEKLLEQTGSIEKVSTLGAEDDINAIMES